MVSRHELQENSPGSRPFVGRVPELEIARTLIASAAAGHGAAAMVSGDPGIGKSRLMAEISEAAKSAGFVVLAGVCVQEGSQPYAPFVQALTAYVNEADPVAVRTDLTVRARSLHRLLPLLRDMYPELDDPLPLEARDERLRLLDDVSQFLIAVSRRAPLLLVIDDLHWADEGTLEMLRHLLRASREARVLGLGAYRDVEVGDQHALPRVLNAIRLETTLQTLRITGLAEEDVDTLSRGILQGELGRDIVETISRETQGNPFFIGEVLEHLRESGAITRDQDGRLATTAQSVADLGIPATVREAVDARLSRLTDSTRKMLVAASAFAGEFRLAVAAAATDLDVDAALNALDEALGAHMLHATGGDGYDFSHALVRHSLYEAMNPSRKVRLHRRIAEKIEEIYGDQAGELAEELVYHYQQSASLPGVERGVRFALESAQRAQYVYAWEDLARLLKAALDMMPVHDDRRTETLANMGRALPYTSAPREAEAVASEAADLLAQESGPDTAAGFLADIAMDMATSAAFGGAVRLSEKGLRFSGNRRDFAWARMRVQVLNKADIDDPDFPGIELASPERRELSDVIRSLPQHQQWSLAHLILFDSRVDLLDFAANNDVHTPLLRAGNFRYVASVFESNARQLEETGRLGVAATTYAILAKVRAATGEIKESYEAYDKARHVAKRLPMTSNPFGNLMDARIHRIFARGEGWERMAASDMFLQAVPRRGQAGARAGVAQIYAELGRAEDSLELISLCIPAIERGPAGSDFYPLVVTALSEALWILGRTDHIETIERNMLEKLIAPDFRSPMRDGRRSMAHLCALQGRYGEAGEWFQKARVALEEDGQRPLRAITDFDEALMYIRRGRRGDRQKAGPLLEAALRQFENIGMTGWIARAGTLSGQAAPAFPDKLTGREVEVLRLIAAGRTNREISDELALSYRTVARHITNIYGKIGARSKADATAYAMRNNLITHQ